LDLSSTIRLLGDTLGRVLREQESPALFATEEEIRGLAKARRAGDPEAAARLTTEVAALSPAAARATASAFTVYFDLVNLAEEAQRIRALRERERTQTRCPASPPTWTRRCASTTRASSRPPGGSRWPRGSAATGTATRWS
jgi:phosphoenolpyruvate carboxylase